MSYGLGIDTGGTYTDSAIIDLVNGKVLSKAKALTTRNDLSIGIFNSIDKLDKSTFKDIELVSVSSTLATNSVVEGKGCRVGLIVVGHEFDRSIPVNEQVQIEGGHNLNGDEKELLDLDAAQAFVEATKDKVDGYAISSYLSVRNPEHEIALKELIQSMTSLPAVSGHELSSRLGFPERTLTAILNARLIPIIADLVQSVNKVLKDHGIQAPLMIVKGDGSLMGEAIAKERPVETILSGPAASLTGARFLTKKDDAVVIDVGGTTTDIGILRGGRPRLDPEGAMIGGWRTRVRAADISTSGIGGDSRIVIHQKAIYLSPLRVVPLCIAQSIYPSIKEKLNKAKDLKVRPQAGHTEMASIGQVDEFFIFSKEVKGFDLSSEEEKLVSLVKKQPLSIFEVSEITGIHPYSFNVRRLEELGIIQRIGLTPTDILHAAGTYVEYDPEPSRIAVGIQSKAMNMTEEEFCATVKRKVIDKIATELLKKLVYEETGKIAYCDVATDFFDKFVTLSMGEDYSCRLKLNKTIIGIGAPVEAYLPQVAEKFQTDLMLPEHMEVGNAVGAITSSVIESVEILIKPKPGMGVMENPPSLYFSPTEKRDFEDMEQAVRYATESGGQIVRERAEAAGAESIQIVVDRDDMRASMGSEWGGDVLLECRLTITAIGKPRQFHEVAR
ncbi:MAG TPA: hydantoinase/oxoprolinase family protein [Methanomassiliicoccales archaeon]|nr:hydantoinase/oxoprolinase family protein [Methanomassiliicoccales archaeon]